MYARSEEYESLLAFCKPYGKAIWPLVMEKAVHSIFEISLLEDLTIPKYLILLDETEKIMLTDHIYGCDEQVTKRVALNRLSDARR